MPLSAREETRESWAVADHGASGVQTLSRGYSGAKSPVQVCSVGDQNYFLGVSSPPQHHLQGSLPGALFLSGRHRRQLGEWGRGCCPDLPGGGTFVLLKAEVAGCISLSSIQMELSTS